MSSTVWGDKFVRRARPRSRMTGSQWAEKYRYVAPGTSPEPGPWRNSRVPYLVGPLDSMTDSSTEITVMMCSSQIGKSELLLNIMGYYADQQPSPQLMLQPTVEAAEAFSKERIDPTFRYSSGLKDKLVEGKDGRGTSRKSGDTIRMKHYPGGYLALVGANSPSGLASRPIRVLLADEVDRYGFTKEGDPLKLAIQRTTNFHNKKIGLVSTPTVKDQSKIEHWWLRSNQQHYQVPCPHCGSMQRLKWANVKWEKDEKGDGVAATAYYQCQDCEGHITDADKPQMLAAGAWVADKPEVTRIQGYHINAIYSPWVKLASLVEEWLEIHRKRSKQGLMEFINLKLGEVWEEDDDDFGWEHLNRRKEYYDAEVPEGAVLLTAGVDTQDDRLETEVVGWGVGRESWGIEYRVFMGDPGMPQVWKDVDEYLQRQFRHQSGASLSIACACIDTQGHHTQDVYEFTKPREYRRVFSIRGKGGQGVPFINKPNRNNRVGAALFNIGVDAGKANIMARVRIEDEGAGYCHWPRHAEAGYDEDYFKGLLSEKYIYKYVNGQPKTEWKKIYERNEPLDVRNYATAAMEIVNPNFEWLAQQLKDGKVYTAHRPSKGRKKKRIISRGVS